MKKYHLSVFASLSLCASVAYANYLLPMPFEEQRAKADAVLLVRAGQNTQCATGSMQVPCVELNDPLYLKGQAGRRVSRTYLVTYNGIPESRVDCCDPGATYLMFVRRGGDYFYPVAGHWSILRTDRAVDATPRPNPDSE